MNKKGTATWQVHVNKSLVFLYMADSMQMSSSKLPGSLRKASESHSSKLIDFAIRRPLREASGEEGNLPGHMTDMLWIPLAVIL